MPAPRGPVTLHVLESFSSAHQRPEGPIWEDFVRSTLQFISVGGQAGEVSKVTLISEEVPALPGTVRASCQIAQCPLPHRVSPVPIWWQEIAPWWQYPGERRRVGETLDGAHRGEESDHHEHREDGALLEALPELRGDGARGVLRDPRGIRGGS